MHKKASTHTQLALTLCERYFECMHRSSFMLLMLASPVFAAPIAGIWKIDGDVQGHPVRETCTLAGDDTALTGTCVGEKTVPATATRKDDIVKLTHAGEYQGQALMLTFTGKLQPDGSLHGSIDVQPLNYDGVFTATREAQKP